MTEIELARKRGKHNLKRKREHRLKVILSKTKEGRSLWNTRKHGKFVSQLISMGFTLVKSRCTSPSLLFLLPLTDGDGECACCCRASLRMAVWM